MARLTLFGGRELWINSEALRHPIDAMRQRLAQPAFELRQRTNPAPPPPRRVPFAPLNVDIGPTLSESIGARQIAHEAAEAGRRAATLRALRSLAKHEDFPTPTHVSVHIAFNGHQPLPEHRYGTDEQVKEAIAALDPLNATQLTQAVRNAVADALDTAHRKNEQPILPIGERHGAKSSMRTVLAVLAEVHKRGRNAILLLERPPEPESEIHRKLLAPLEKLLPPTFSPESVRQFDEKWNERMKSDDWRRAATWQKAASVFVANRLGFRFQGFDAAKQTMQAVDPHGDEREQGMIAGIVQQASANPEAVVIVLVGSAHVKPLHQGLRTLGHVAPLVVDAGYTPGQGANAVRTRERVSYNLAHAEVKYLRPEDAVNEQPVGLLKLTRELGIDMTC